MVRRATVTFLTTIFLEVFELGLRFLLYRFDTWANSLMCKTQVFQNESKIVTVCLAANEMFPKTTAP